MENRNQNLQPIDEVWKKLDRATNTLYRNVDKVLDLLEQVVSHALSNSCHLIEVPKRKEGHIKEREKYARDYKQCILEQMNLKLKQGFTKVGAKAICQRCYMECKNNHRFFIHLLQKHCELKLYSCGECFERFDSYNKFKTHLCSHHEGIMIFTQTENILQIIEFGIRELEQIW